MHSNVNVLASGLDAFASFKAYFKSGLKEYKQGNYSNAARCFRTAIQNSESSDMAHYYLANSLMKLGKKGEAISEYKKAYILARSPQMNRNCAHVLKSFNVKLPERYKESMSTRSARANMTPYKVASIKDITAQLGKSSNIKLKDSHPGGPDKFTTVPEVNNGMKEKWDKWIQDFRLSFNRILYSKVGSAKFALWGRSKVVFSVDKNRKLRSRIVSSGAPYFWDHYILETTRQLDRSSVLNFPTGSNIPGYNFSMGWNNGSSKKRMSRQTMIALRNIQAKLKRNPISGQRAVANRLNTRRVRSSLSTKNVSAVLKQKNANGVLTSEKAGKIPLPSFDTKVSGLLLPQKKLKALKAKQHTMKPLGDKKTSNPEKN